jgi:RNA polymerase sigma factor (sigma-70 family)
VTHKTTSRGTKSRTTKSAKAAAPEPAAERIDSTEDLIHKARVGDRSAESEIVRRNLPGLRRFAHGRLPSAARHECDTEDLVQETMLHTLQRLPSFEARRPGALQAYLRMAIQNRVRDEYRRLGRHGAPVELSDVVDTGPSPFDEASEKEIASRQQAAMEQLRPTDRALLVARIELGYDYKQIARLLGKPTAEAARVAVGRALRRAVEAAQLVVTDSDRRSRNRHR